MQAEKATGGRAAGPDWVAKGVSIDTRTLQPGDLFVALKDVRDGHQFVAQAFAAGAAAAMVSHVPEGLSADAPLLIVDDVLHGLEALGKAARERTGAQVIAVTGSAGKTSTKDMLRHVLGAQGKVHAAEASYNNHWGVPLTLARMPEDTDFAVIEIGMNHPGEIAPLSRLTRPQIAIVTTVAPAHLEAFESVEDIAREKGAIFEGLEPGGTAIFNADIETWPLLNAAAKGKGRRIGFGTGADAVMAAEKITVSDEISIVEGRFAGAPFLFKLGAPGRHMAMNALAVCAVVKVLELDADVAAMDLGIWSPSKGRGTRELILMDPIEDIGFDLIDDAFNANPASLAAAFDVLAATVPKAGGRRIAILGDMLELGPQEAALHTGFASHPAIAGIARVDCVGPRMKAMYEALPAEKRGRWVATADELASDAHQLVRPDDVVLVKGSKGSKVSQVAVALRKLGRARKKGAE